MFAFLWQCKVSGYACVLLYRQQQQEQRFLLMTQKTVKLQIQREMPTVARTAKLILASPFYKYHDMFTAQCTEHFFMKQLFPEWRRKCGRLSSGATHKKILKLKKANIARNQHYRQDNYRLLQTKQRVSQHSNLKLSESSQPGITPCISAVLRTYDSPCSCFYVPVCMRCRP